MLSVSVLGHFAPDFGDTPILRRRSFIRIGVPKTSVLVCLLRAFCLLGGKEITTKLEANKVSRKFILEAVVLQTPVF